MSKLTNALNQIWYEQSGKVVKIGFTRSFLDTLDECWHILPAKTEFIKEKSPLMVVETNASLVSILSPVAGNVQFFDNYAINFPDKLNEDSTIMELTTDKVVREEEDDIAPWIGQHLEREDMAQRLFNPHQQRAFTVEPPPPVQANAQNAALQRMLDLQQRQFVLQNDLERNLILNEAADLANINIQPRRAARFNPPPAPHPVPAQPLRFEDNEEDF